MKRLISTEEVLYAKEHGEHLVVDAQTIITPSARDLAREYGIAFVDEYAATSQPAEVHEVHSCGCNKTQPVKQGCCCGGTHKEEAILDADEIYRILKAAIDYGLWSESELIEALKALG